MQNNVNDQQNNSIEKRKEKRLDKSLVQVQWIYVGFFFLLNCTLAPSSLTWRLCKYDMCAIAWVYKQARVLIVTSNQWLEGTLVMVPSLWLKAASSSLWLNVGRMSIYDIVLCIYMRKMVFAIEITAGRLGVVWWDTSPCRCPWLDFTDSPQSMVCSNDDLSYS